jgi:hypothetical protein
MQRAIRSNFICASGKQFTLYSPVLSVQTARYKVGISKYFLSISSTLVPMFMDKFSLLSLYRKNLYGNYNNMG